LGEKGGWRADSVRAPREPWEGPAYGWEFEIEEVRAIRLPPQPQQKTGKQPTKRKGSSRIHAAIRQGAAEEWPGGYEHVATADIIDAVSPKLKGRIPHRSTWERALGRKQS